MDSHIVSFIKTAIAIIFWPLVLGAFIVTWQLSQIQNFQQYASGVISREGGLTKSAIEQIDRESLDHYRGVFRVTTSDGQFVTYTTNHTEDGKTIKRGTYKGGLSDNQMRIQPYGRSIEYNVQAKPTAFNDIPVIKSVGDAIKLQYVWSTTALNRNAGAIAKDDTTVIDDNDDPNSNLLLPQNASIQIHKSDYASRPNSFLLEKLLQAKGTITSVDVADDNREETIAQVIKSGSSWAIKPLKSGSTSVKLTIKVKAPDGSLVTIARTYVIVVL